MKEIFKKAINILETGKRHFMCPALVLAAGRDESILYEAEKHGFTLKNFSKFIHKNYPELEGDLLRHYHRGSDSWLNMYCIVPRIKFLKHLANECERNITTSR